MIRGRTLHANRGRVLRRRGRKLDRGQSLVEFVLALPILLVIVFGIMVVFSVLTIPVEVDASRRGTKLLEQAGLMQADSDRKGTKQVLTAAASTYVAAAVTSILQLLYYISIARRRR